ncbi:hypothetical protein [Luteolibacter soli]|uniref:Uncharacterized protein n=1 Tax=Luteolibacter soli TaxID=3135280 RepID=A0ABU9AN30_9BACT
MKEWFVTHIDALIPLAIGLYVALKVAIKRKSGTVEHATLKRATVGALVLIAIGLFRLFTDLATPLPDPVTATTDDGKVSVIFPKEPVRTEAVDEAPGAKAHRVTRACNFPGIDLRLSFNPYPPGGNDSQGDAILANMKKLLEEKGFSVAGSSELPGQIHELLLEKPAEGIKQTMRVWYGPGGIYRAMATTEAGHHDDSRARNFISSFRVIAAGPEK